MMIIMIITVKITFTGAGYNVWNIILYDHLMISLILSDVYLEYNIWCAFSPKLLIFFFSAQKYVAIETSN